MSASEHERVLGVLAEIMSVHDWDRLGEVLHDDAVFEFPQSGERFRSIANIRAQFENYPALDPGTSQLQEVIGDDAFALTPAYTLIRVEGSGGKGTAVVRVRYPDGSLWWVINLYDLREGKISRLRGYFAPDFDAPEWRAPYREAP